MASTSGSSAAVVKVSGTRSAISLDALWDLDEAQYDAEVHFSDGTSYVLNLNNPQSIIKCFPYVPFFKSACLRIYEEGGLAAGDAPCYEVCESDACITLETIPPHLFEQVAPTLGLNPASCTVTATPIRMRWSRGQPHGLRHPISWRRITCRIPRCLPRRRLLPIRS